MIDFQGLLEVLRCAEREQNLRMNTWKCGAAHCMIGSFCDQNKHDNLKLVINTTGDDRYIPVFGKSEFISAVSERFGITRKEAQWLFARHPMIDNIFNEGSYPSNANSRSSSAEFLCKDRALARLRKFIYYKLHKQEMIVEKGRNKEVVLPKNISGRRSAMLASCA